MSSAAVVISALRVKNEFYYSEVHGSVNYIGSHLKLMNPKGVHVYFASDLM